MREPKTEGRVVRKGLLESERWLTLKDNADRLAYLSLLLNCDDYGNYSGERYRLLRMWRDFGITSTELVAKSLNEMQDHDLIGIYDVDGRPFIHIMRLFNTRQYWNRSYPQSPFPDDVDNPKKQRHTNLSINHVLDQPKLGVRGKGLGELQKQHQPLSDSASLHRPIKANSKAKPQEPRSAETWAAYADAYYHRYGVNPVRNAKVSGMLCKLVDRIGSKEAPHVAAFYLTHSQASYVRSKHCVDLLLKDCEGLRTEWATDTAITDTQARQADKTASIGNVFKDLINEVKNGK